MPEATTSRFEPGRTRPVPTLGLIHNSPMLAAVFNEIAARVMPDVRILHFVDESTIKNTIAAGRLEKATMRQVIRLVGSTFDAGCDAALVTCSRSEERRVGTECVRTCSTRWSPDHYKQKNQINRSRSDKSDN